MLVVPLVMPRPEGLAARMHAGDDRVGPPQEVHGGAMGEVRDDASPDHGNGCVRRRGVTDGKGQPRQGGGVRGHARFVP